MLTLFGGQGFQTSVFILYNTYYDLHILKYYPFRENKFNIYKKKRISVNLYNMSSLSGFQYLYVYVWNKIR